MRYETQLEQEDGTRRPFQRSWREDLESEEVLDLEPLSAEQPFYEAPPGLRGKKHKPSKPATNNPPFKADSPVVNKVRPANLNCGVQKNANGSLKTRGVSDITHVVIHTMVGRYGNVIRSWETSTQGRGCLKPHYAVNDDGEITQVVPEKFISFHANQANSFSIGIEHDGFANDPKFYTEKMYAASAALTRDICGRHGIPINRARIIGHEEAPGASHSDPGGYWDWDYYLALVQWDGTPATRPVRIVIDSVTGGSVRQGSWTSVVRSPIKDAPQAADSWSKSFFQAKATSQPIASAGATYFATSVPVAGNYEISMWWPVAKDKNPEAVVFLGIGNPPVTVVGTWVNQTSSQGRTRAKQKGGSTPTWFLLHKLALKAGDALWVVISQSSKKNGLIAADAVKLLKQC